MKQLKIFHIHKGVQRELNSIFKILVHQKTINFSAKLQSEKKGNVLV